MFSLVLIVVLVGHGLIRKGELAQGKVLGTIQHIVYGNTRSETLGANGLVSLGLEAGHTAKTVKKIFESARASSNTIKIGFVGDIMPGISTETDLFSLVTPYLEKPDLMIGNFEGAIASETHSKCKSGNTRCYAFGGDTKFLELLKNASFDVLSVANNHFNDYGAEGQLITAREIQNAGITLAGLQNKITYVERKNLMIGIVGFSAYKWTTDINNPKKVTELVQEAEKYSDIVIVLFHGGAEGAAYTHVPHGPEWYLGENRGDLREFSRIAIDAGADIVVGSGPHVLRGMEWYNGKLIVYSLGNFAFANGVSTAGPLKTSAILEIDLEKDGTFAAGKITPIEIHYSGNPLYDNAETAVTLMNELSESDFGEQGVVLDADGEIK